MIRMKLIVGIVLLTLLINGCSSDEGNEVQDQQVKVVETENTEISLEEEVETTEENVDIDEIEEVEAGPIWQVPGMVDAKGQPYTSPEANKVTGITHNVLDYGAVANDPDFDNVDSIMAAIEAAQPGDEIYIPEGTYWLTKPSKYSKAYIAHIELEEGINLRGDGLGKTILMSAFPDSDNEDGNTTVVLINGQNNIVVSDLTITSNTPDDMLPNPDDQNTNTLVTTSPVYGIAIDSDSPIKQFSNVVIKDILVEKFQRMGIRVKTVRDVRIQSCTIQKATDLGRGGAGYAISIQGTKNGINITDTNYDTIHNVVEDCDLIGPYLRHGVILQYHAHNNLITNNRISDTLLDSIDLHGEDEYNNEVVANTIINSRKGAGIGLGNSGATHDASGPNNLIHKNEIIGGNRGIDVLYGTSGTIITGNTIRDLTLDGTTGILIRDAHDTLVSDNSFSNMIGQEATAIAVYYAYDALEPTKGIPSGIEITNNNFTELYNGVYIETHGDGFVYEGNVYSNIMGIDYDNQRESFITPEVSDVVIPKEGIILYPTDDNYITNEMRTSPQMQANMKFKSSYFDVPYNRMIYIKFDLFEAPDKEKVYLKFTAKSKDGLMNFNIYGSTTYTDWDERKISWETAPYHEDQVAIVSDPDGELTLITDFTFPAAGDVFNTYYVDLSDYIKSIDQNQFTLILANDSAQDMYSEIYSKDISQDDYKLSLIFSD